MVVEYFDSILIIQRWPHCWCWHLQDPHSVAQLKDPSYFGDLMQYNTGVGEQGLKVWAKCMS
jgi:hypothetical protein